ncbi:MAG: cytochrome c family protein [Paracoccaceae bacterium]
MFDTMTITKVLGAVCGSLLVFLLGSWAGSALYGLGEAGHGEHAEQAYSIDTGAAEAAGEGAAEVPFADLFAKADPAAGEKVFAKCKACHKIDGTNGTGPHLNGVVNRNEGSVEGFAYSPAMAGRKDKVWEPENIFHFLQNPKAYVAGTKMSFAGLPKPEDRVNVIAFLAQHP